MCFTRYTCIDHDFREIRVKTQDLKDINFEPSIAIQRIFVCVYAKNVLQRLYITLTITLLEGMYGYKKGKANCITGAGSDRCADLSLL